MAITHSVLQPQGHVEARQRALAPDLARGVMLLLIAVVHVQMFHTLAGGPEGPGDDLVRLAVTVLAENRGYPMFAALFGYGLTRIALRQEAQGMAPFVTRSLLRRRGGWLIVIGFVHTALLSFGDILATYGVLALVFAGAVANRKPVLGRWGLGGLALGPVLYSVAMTLLAQLAGEADGAAVSPWMDMALRLSAWPVSTVLFLSISVFPFAIGCWAGRRAIMDRPQDHAGLLRRAVALGLPLAVLGGIPKGLIVIGSWAPGMAGEIAATWLHVVTGYAGGLSYAALIALVAMRLSGAAGPIVGVLAATGQRSLSCYLWQSLAWFALFMPYTLDLASRVSAGQAVLIGAVVWLAGVMAAAAMERAGRSGPAETFLRARIAGR